MFNIIRMNKFKVYKFIVKKKMTPSLDTGYRVGGVTIVPEGTQPRFPFPNSRDPPSTLTDSKKKTFQFF